MTLQITSALQKLALLQRRAEQLATQPPKLVSQAMKELEGALEELQVAQHHLAEQRHELALTRVELENQRQQYWQLFDGAPDAHLVTSTDVRILEANRAAAELLNISQRFLIGKNLAIFVCHERSRVLVQAKELANEGGTAEWIFSVRPRERAPLEVAARVVASFEAREPALRWMLRRVTQRAPQCSTLS
jgi:PAS domain S-box-containing protein